MKKFYPPLLAALLVSLPMALSAQTMTGENETLTNYGDGFRLEKDVDFVGAMVNGVAIEPSTGLTFSGETDYKVNNNTLSKISNTGLEFLALHTMKNNYSWAKGQGLRTTSNERWISIPDLRKGQIFVVDQAATDESQFVVNSNACNGNTSWADTFQDPLILEEISAEIHELQDLAAGEGVEGNIEEGNGESTDATHDSFRYYMVINTGTVYIKVNKNTIYRFQIWTPNGEEEVVSVPTMSMVGVNYDARNVALTAGVSTLGNEVFTYYTTDGSEPVYQKESDEVESYVVYDEDGETVLRSYTVEQYENSEIPDEDAGLVTPVKKMVLDVESTFGSLEGIGTEGYVGDGNMFDPNDEYFSVNVNDDDDEDGIVMVKAVSVSVSGAISKVVSLPVAVGTITLNQPTLTWVGFDGMKRSYKIGWTSNMPIAVEYTLSYTADDGLMEGETAVGEVISFENNVVLTIQANGYEDGVLNKDADVSGIEMKRKFDRGVDEAEMPLHDWEFQNMSQEILNMINGEITDHYAQVDEDGNEVFTCSEEEYNEKQLDLGEYGDGDVIPDELAKYVNMQRVPKYYGWDALDNRMAGRHWRTWIPTYELDGEGNPTETILSSVYAEDETGLFHDMVVDNAHPKWSTIAIHTVNKEGLRWDQNGTMTFSGDVVKYGEYIVVTTNSGTTVYESNALAEGYTLNVKSGTYIYNIDIYTYDSLPEPPEEVVGIEGVKANTVKKTNVIYNLAGQRVDSNYKGIVIKDGKKVLVK